MEEIIVKTETTPLSPESQTETASSITSGSSEQPQIQDTEEEIHYFNDKAAHSELFPTTEKEVSDECDIPVDSTKEVSDECDIPVDSTKEVSDECDIPVDSTKDDRDAVAEELVESVTVEEEINGQTYGNSFTGTFVDNGTTESIEANKLCEERYLLTEDASDEIGKDECEINETERNSHTISVIDDENKAPNELEKSSGIADASDNQQVKGEELKSSEIEEQNAIKTEDEPQIIETSVKIVISPSISHDSIDKVSFNGKIQKNAPEMNEIHEQLEETKQEMAMEEAIPIGIGIDINDDIKQDMEENKSTGERGDPESIENKMCDAHGEEKLLSQSSEAEETQSSVKETEIAHVLQMLDNNIVPSAYSTEKEEDQLEESPAIDSKKHKEHQENNSSIELNSLVNKDESMKEGVDLPYKEADSETHVYEKDIDTTIVYIEMANKDVDLNIQEDIHLNESRATSPVEENNENVQATERSIDHLAKTLGFGEDNVVHASVKDTDPDQSAEEIITDKGAKDQEVLCPPKLSAKKAQDLEEANYANIDPLCMEIEGVIDMSASMVESANIDADKAVTDYMDQEETKLSTSKSEIKESEENGYGSTELQDDKHLSAKDESDDQKNEDLQNNQVVSEVSDSKGDDCSEIHEKLLQEEEAIMPIETGDTHMSFKADKQNGDVISSTDILVSAEGTTLVEQHENNALDRNNKNEYKDSAEKVECKPGENESLDSNYPDPSDTQLKVKTLDGINESSQMSAEAKVDEIKGEEDSSDPHIILQNKDSKTYIDVQEETNAKPESAVNGFQEQSGDDLMSDTTDLQGDSQVSMKMMRGEVSAKTTYQRTSTGPVAISEVSPEGKFLVLENTSSGPNRREVNLDGWKIKRTVDGKHDYIYPFRNFTLKAGKKVKILARGSAAEAGLNDLVFRDEDTWGVGSQVTTVLINEKDEEKASHVQKTLYN